MENIYTNIAIIGGGASGIVCAIAAKEKYKNIKKFSVTIIEKENKLGRKILATGNGRCNLTNINTSVNKFNTSYYNNENEKNIEYLISKYPPEYIISFFKKIGLYCKIEKDGRVYPYSNQAVTVLDILNIKLKSLNINELCDTTVLNVKKDKNKFIILSDNKKIITDKIVFATGGKSTPNLGSDGSCFNILKSLNHTVTKLTPGLSPIHVKSKVIKSLKGVRAEGKITLTNNNKEIKSYYGEIQFTEKALSGICVFNIARYIEDYENSKLIVSLLPTLNKKSIENLIKNKINIFKNENLENLFTGLFNKKIGLALLKECNISPLSRKINTLTNKEIVSLVNIIDEWEFNPIKSNEFKQSQITKGGIPLTELKYKTMESKINKNMFICGEALDVDGECGGYNLQFAFSTGILTGENL